MFRWIRYWLRRRRLYRVYTRDFDEQVRASDLLGVLASEPSEPVSEPELSTRLRAALSEAGGDLGPDDQVIVLVDQSGSLKGRRMAVSALIADKLSVRLEAAGVRHEVLGFTTVGWKGGRSRERWLADRTASRKPGRLCDLRHIVYKAMDDGPEWRVALPLMTADILREGVDGEAVEWAVSRFAPGDGRKILIQIGDGSPNDDSSLRESGPWLLQDHFLKVLAALPDRGVRYILLSFVQWKLPIPHRYLGRDGAEAPDVVAKALDEIIA